MLAFFGELYITVLFDPRQHWNQYINDEDRG